LVLIATLHAADSRQDGNWFQSASFSLAWALSFLLIAGLFLVNPYISDPGQGIILLPHIQWITNTFNKEAADVVSVCIVGVVAIIWFIIRRRFFALHQAPSQPRKPKFVPSNSSGQLLQSLDLAE